MTGNKIYSVMFEWADAGKREGLIELLKSRGFVVVNEGEYRDYSQDFFEEKEE